MGLFDLFKKKEKPKPEYISGYQFEPEGKTARARINVVGLKYENRYKKLKDYLNSLNRKPYHGLSDKNIETYPWTVYEYSCDGTEEEMQLVPEPDNKHDPDAIGVILGGVHMGYVPADDCKRVKKIIDSDHSIWWYTQGGKSKRYDEYTKKVKQYSDKLELRFKLYKKQGE